MRRLSGLAWRSLAARRLLGNEAIIGFSTHNPEQAKLASALPVNYLAFGPVFQTSTKDNPDPVTGLITLKEVAAIKGSRPLVGIGGVTFETAVQVFTAGADSVAVIAEVLSDPTRIAENMNKMLALSKLALNN